jgi:hypothetical protein
MSPRLRRIAATLLLVAGVALGVSLASAMPATTRQGVDFAVSTHTIPLSVKTLDFLQRDANYRLLAREITRGRLTDRDRAQAVFAWTRAHIPHTPKGWTVVDDHILHIIIRGHGLDDQQADVFTTLLTYAGVPAFWQIIKTPGTSSHLVLSFARVDGRWAVFDVSNGFVFTHPSGRLAGADELAADPALVSAVSGDLQFGDGPYARYFAPLDTLEVPRPLRARMQMPWPRLVHEATQRLTRRRHGGA